MKKIFCALMAMLVAVTLCACAGQKEQAMYVKPCEFSGDALEILEILDDEIQFFDIGYDDSAKSMALSLWAMRDGEWQELGGTYGNVEDMSERIAVRLNESGCALYIMDDSGHEKISYPMPDVSFEGSLMTGSAKVDREAELELDREIALWVKVGTDAGSMEVMDITQDFREIECSVGVAVTLTVSDQPVE